MKYVCGLLACDAVETRTAKHSFDVIWFLNLALAYRDMMAKDLYGKFVLKYHTPESYWLMGCCGPFGILDKNLLGKITYPMLKNYSRLKPKQFDSCNCGVICCLFMMDIMQQALTTYDFDFKIIKKKDDDDSDEELNLTKKICCQVKKELA